MIRTVKILLISFLIALSLQSCKSQSNKTNFASWDALSLSQKEYVAEVYRLGIAIAYWQCKIAELNCQIEKNGRDNPHSEMLQTIQRIHTICLDRIRLSQRLANQQQLNWLDQLMVFMEQHTLEHNRNYTTPIVGNNFTTVSSMYPRIEIDWNKSVILYPFENSFLPLWKFNPTYPCDSLWYAFPSSLEEPLEIRSPMAKLIQSHWTVPKDGGYQQRVRWEKMVLTEFDHPSYQLGGIQKQKSGK